MERSTPVNQPETRKALVWVLFVGPAAAAIIFWLLPVGEGPSRSGSPVAELILSSLVAPAVTRWASDRFDVPTRMRPALLVLSLMLAFVFWLAIYLGIQVFFGSST